MIEKLQINIFGKNVLLQENKINFFPKFELGHRFYDQFKKENIFGTNLQYGDMFKKSETSDLKVFVFGKEVFDQQNHAQTFVGGQIFKFKNVNKNDVNHYFGVEDNDIFFSVLAEQYNPNDYDLLIINDFTSGLSSVAKVAFYQNIKLINKIFNKTVLLVSNDILTLKISKVDDFILFADEHEKFEIKKFFELIDAVDTEKYEQLIHEISDNRKQLYKNLKK